MTSQEIVAPIPGETKLCSKCKEAKPLGDFGTYSYAKDGKKSHCKKCISDYYKGYRSKKSINKPKKERKNKVPITGEGKPCCACKKFKPYAELSKDKAKPGGHSSDCKACRSKRQKEYQRKDSSLISFTRIKYRAFRDKTLREIKDIYDEALASQQGLCAICSRPETAKYKGITKRLSIDHCHVTGIFRGLLCHQCNVMLGRFGDNPETLQRAIDYLQKS